MENKQIIVVNGSRVINSDIPLEAIAEINGILLPVGVEHTYIENTKMIDEIIKEGNCFEKDRIEQSKFGNGQVNYQKMVLAVHDRFKGDQTIWRPGKLIIIDEDMYSGDREKSNFLFGARSKLVDSLGYVILSSARLTYNGESKINILDMFKHELGHMFGAALEPRSNTKIILGRHCTNENCVMQQKLSEEESEKYALERFIAKSPVYCPQCVSDIRKFKIPTE